MQGLKKMRSTIVNDWKDYGNKYQVNFRLVDFGVNSGFKQFSLSLFFLILFPLPLLLTQQRMADTYLYIYTGKSLSDKEICQEFGLLPSD